MVARLKRWLKRALPAVALVILLALLAGSIYEQIGRRLDARSVTQVGKSVDIGGRRLNLYCSGEGSPAVIFESGGGAPGFTWVNIQPQVANSPALVGTIAPALAGAIQVRSHEPVRP